MIQKPSGQSRNCLNNPEIFRTTSELFGQFKNCPDNPETVKNCPDNLETVWTIKKLS